MKNLQSETQELNINDSKSENEIEKHSEKTINDPFKVLLRIRPLFEKDKIKPNSNNYYKKSADPSINPFTIVDNSIQVKDPSYINLNIKSDKNFNFDKIYDGDYGNLEIFSSGIKSIIENLMEGYNSTCLAYGITGSGKTHTIFGNIYNDMSITSFNEKNKENIDLEKGLCYYSVDYLFQKIQDSKNKEIKVKVSYLEIYNETVIDLLAHVSHIEYVKDTPKVKYQTNIPNKNLMIIEDSNKGIIVTDLNEFKICNTKDFETLITEGNRKRTMASTQLNQFSSRSHAIIIITLEQKEFITDIKHNMLTSKFLLVDLAGSEKLAEKYSKRSHEGANINKSLLSLGNCINILSDPSKKGSFIPYRDSKLTRLLKDSLGGNIMTVMIACISPSVFQIDETISTLKYAVKAKRIKKSVSKNVKELDMHISQYKDIIDSLKLEVESLKEILKIQSIRVQEDTEKMLLLSEFNSQNVNKSQNCKKKSIEKNIIESDKTNNCLDENNLNINIQNECFNSKSNPNQIIEENPQNIENVVDIDVDVELNEIENNLELLNKKKNQLESQIENTVSLNYSMSKIRHKEEDVNSSAKHFNENLLKQIEMIKCYYSKYLELINSKLIDNIEQNTLLKYNIKELIELNDVNNDLLVGLANHKKEILSKNIPSNVKNDLLRTNCQEEIVVKNNILENEKLKSEVVSALEENIKQKKLLRKLLQKVINNSKLKINFDNNLLTENHKRKNDNINLKSNAFNDFNQVKSLKASCESLVDKELESNKIKINDSELLECNFVKNKSNLKDLINIDIDNVVSEIGISKEEKNNIKNSEEIEELLNLNKKLSEKLKVYKQYIVVMIKEKEENEFEIMNLRNENNRLKNKKIANLNPNDLKDVKEGLGLMKNKESNNFNNKSLNDNIFNKYQDNSNRSENKSEKTNLNMNFINVNVNNTTNANNTNSSISTNNKMLNNIMLNIKEKQKFVNNSMKDSTGKVDTKEEVSKEKKSYKNLQLQSNINRNNFYSLTKEKTFKQTHLSGLPLNKSESKKDFKHVNQSNSVEKKEVSLKEARVSKSYKIKNLTNNIKTTNNTNNTSVNRNFSKERDTSSYRNKSKNDIANLKNFISEVKNNIDYSLGKLENIPKSKMSHTKEKLNKAVVYKNLINDDIIEVCEDENQTERQKMKNYRNIEKNNDAEISNIKPNEVYKDLKDDLKIKEYYKKPLTNYYSSLLAKKQNNISTNSNLNSDKNTNNAIYKNNANIDKSNKGHKKDKSVGTNINQNNYNYTTSSNKQDNNKSNIRSYLDAFLFRNKNKNELQVNEKDCETMSISNVSIKNDTSFYSENELVEKLCSVRKKNSTKNDSYRLKDRVETDNNAINTKNKLLLNFNNLIDEEITSHEIESKKGIFDVEANKNNTNIKVNNTYSNDIEKIEKCKNNEMNNIFEKDEIISHNTSILKEKEKQLKNNMNLNNLTKFLNNIKADCNFIESNKLENVVNYKIDKIDNFDEEKKETLIDIIDEEKR